jgi:NAD(P)-dependent dehydrogenase (short-subunit alcohol dehydrogenase family)
MDDGAISPLKIFAPALFRGKTALVTGGGRGIGRAIALGFAELGANVVIASRKAEHLEPTQREIEALGVSCLAVPMSIREVEQVDALAEQSYARFGKIDFLINNAGGQFPARPWDISDRGFRAVVDLNLNGTWNMCSRFGKRMAEQRSGSIVNVVHVYSFERGAPYFAHSGAARAGVVNLTRTLAYYYARYGVNINALAPGSIATQGLYEEEYAKAIHNGDKPDVQAVEAQQKRDIPAHRLGTPEEVAAMTLFLCSPAARYINGASLIADGGQYFGNWPEVPEDPNFGVG